MNDQFDPETSTLSIIIQNAPVVIISFHSIKALRANNVHHVFFLINNNKLEIQPSVLEDLIFKNTDLQLRLIKTQFPVVAAMFPNFLTPPEIDIQLDIELQFLEDQIQEFKKHTGIPLELGFPLSLDQIIAANIGIPPLTPPITPSLSLFNEARSIMPINGWTQVLEDVPTDHAVLCDPALIELRLLHTCDRIYYRSIHDELFQCFIDPSVKKELKEFIAIPQIRQLFTRTRAIPYYRVSHLPYPEYIPQYSYIRNMMNHHISIIDFQQVRDRDQEQQDQEQQDRDRDQEQQDQEQQDRDRDQEQQDQDQEQQVQDRDKDQELQVQLLSYIRNIQYSNIPSLIRTEFLFLGFKLYGTNSKSMLSLYARFLVSDMNPAFASIFPQYIESLPSPPWEYNFYNKEYIKRNVSMLLDLIDWSAFLIDSKNTDLIYSIREYVLNRTGDRSTFVLMEDIDDYLPLKQVLVSNRSNYVMEYLILLSQWVIVTIRDYLVDRFRAQSPLLEGMPNPMDCPQSIIAINVLFKDSNAESESKIHHIIKELLSDRYFYRLQDKMNERKDEELFLHGLLWQFIRDLYCAWNGPEVSPQQRYLIVQRIAVLFGFPVRRSIAENIGSILSAFEGRSVFDDHDFVLYLDHMGEPIHYLSSQSRSRIQKEKNPRDLITIYSESLFTPQPPAPLQVQADNQPLVPTWSHWIYPKKTRQPARVREKLYVGNPVRTYDLNAVSAGDILYYAHLTFFNFDHAFTTEKIHEFPPHPRGGYGVYFLGEVVNSTELNNLNASPWVTAKNSLFDRRLALITIDSAHDIPRLEREYNQSIQLPLKFSNYNTDRFITELCIRLIQQHNATGTIIPQRSFAWGAHLKYQIRTTTLYGGNLFAERGPTSPRILRRSDLESDLIQLLPEAQRNLAARALALEKKIAPFIVQYNQLTRAAATPANYYLYSALSKLAALVVFHNFRIESRNAVFVNNIRASDLSSLIGKLLTDTLKLIPKKYVKKVCSLLFGELDRYFKRKPYCNLQDRDTIKETIRKSIIDKQRAIQFVATNIPISNCTLTAEQRAVLDSPDLESWSESIRAVQSDLENITRSEVVRYYLNEFATIKPARRLIALAAQQQKNNALSDSGFVKRVLEIQREFDRYLYDQSQFVAQLNSLRTALRAIKSNIVRHGAGLGAIVQQLRLPNSVPDQPVLHTDLRTRVQSLSAAWSVLHDYLGRYLARFPSIQGSHLRRIAREQIKRAYLIYRTEPDASGASVDYVFFSVYDANLALYRFRVDDYEEKKMKELEGRRYRRKFSDYRAHILSLLPTRDTDPRWSASEPVRWALLELEFQLSRYCSAPNPMRVSQPPPVAVPPKKIIKKKTKGKGVEEVDEQQPPVPQNPTSGRYSPKLKLKLLIGRLKRAAQFVEDLQKLPEPTVALPFRISDLKYYKKVNRDRPAVRPARNLPTENKKLIEIFESLELCNQLSGRLWAVQGNNINNKRILLNQSLEPRAIAEDLLQCSSGLLDLAEGSDKGAFINLSKWQSFCRLIAPRLNLVAELNDETAIYEQLKSELGDDGGDDGGDDDDVADSNSDWRALNIKVGNSKITILESMLRQLLKIASDERSSLLSITDRVPDLFVPIVSPIGARICNYIKVEGKEISNRVDQIYLIKHEIMPPVNTDDAVDTPSPPKTPLPEGLTAQTSKPLPKPEIRLFLAAVLKAEHSQVNPGLDRTPSQMNAADGYLLIYPVSPRFKDEERSPSESVFTVLNRYYDAARAFCPSLRYIGYDRNAFTTTIGAVYAEFFRLAQYRALLDPEFNPEFDPNYLFLPASAIPTVTELEQDPNIPKKVKDVLSKRALLGKTKYDKLNTSIAYATINGAIVKSRLMAISAGIRYRYKEDRQNVASDRPFDLESSDTLFTALCRLAESFKACGEYYSNGDANLRELSRASLSGERINCNLFDGRSDLILRKSPLGARAMQLRELLREIAMQLVGADNTTDPCSPFNAPLVRIDDRGRFFIDVPINYYSLVGYQTNEKSDSYHTTWCVSTGIDLGQKEFANSCTIRRGESPGPSEVVSGGREREAIRRGRTVRENVKYGFKNGNRRGQIKAVMQRWGSGRRQKQRSRQYVSRTANKTVRATLNQLSARTRMADLVQQQTDLFNRIQALLPHPESTLSIFDYMKRCSLLVPNHELLQLQAHQVERVLNMSGRVMCENLKKFKGRGADLFSRRVSGSASWSLTGQFRDRLKLMCERFGLGVRFVSPHYTSKIAYYGDRGAPEAVAGYIVKVTANTVVKVQVYDSPRTELRDANLSEHLNQCNHVTYEWRDGRLVGMSGAPFPGRKFVRALLREFRRNGQWVSDTKFVEISSGKWVRYEKGGHIYYLDRDYNSALNLADYNEFGFTVQRIALMKRREQSGVRVADSADRRERYIAQLKSNCEAIDNKNMKYIIEFANISWDIKGFLQRSYQSLGIDQLPARFAR